ncbi:MAG: arylsulfatase [Planctomycetia bacterium]|nr:arylsulfatase [Planctomycetia bacterium]
MKTFGLRLVSCCALAAALLAATALRAPAAEKPNIVVILADDLGYGDLTCYNRESKIKTPNIDKLASAGMRLTDAHSPSSVCTPTRYGLLTGRYSWRTSLQRGVYQGYDSLLVEPERVTIAKLLKSSGYATACVGKWHLGLSGKKPADYSQPLTPGPAQCGFDYFFGIPASLDMPPYVFIENDRATVFPSEKIGDSQMRRYGGGGYWRAGAIAPGFKHEDVLPEITRHAIQFLEQSAGKERPFFLYFPLTAPHTPWMPTAEFRGKSQAGWYGDFTVQVDDAVGQVLRTLDRLKVRDSTLVIFTSDNGAHWLPSDIEEWGHRANFPWRGQKSDAFEGGHRVPFVVRWPGHVEPGTTSTQLACHTDILATVAEVVGEKLPSDAAEDSYSLLPALTGSGGGARREAVVHHSGDGMFAIRQGDWKLIEGLGSGGFTQPKTEKPQPGGPTGQLYNLKDGPGETKNLFLDRPEVVAKLQAMLDRYRSEGRSRP